MIDKLGKYEVLGELGHGGMGTVFKGRDPMINRDVAIKVISGHVLNDPSIRKRFYREAQSAGRLSHPNITVIYDVGEHDEMPYIVMELLEGNSLSTLMKSGQMTLEQELDVMTQVAQALHYAHQHKVIHRDIKPDNIHVLPSGRVKVLDFGIARIESEGVTMTNSTIGTPKYMSPEQIDGRQVDHRADIFSYGVLFYEMISGTNPFQSDRLTTTIYRVLNEQPERVRVEGGYLRDDVQDVVFRCLAKNKDDRYPDFGAVIDDLMAVKESLGADGGMVTGGSALPYDEDATRVVTPNNTKTLGGVAPAADRPAEERATVTPASEDKPRWLTAMILVGILVLAVVGGYFAFGGNDEAGSAIADQMDQEQIAGEVGIAGAGQDADGTVSVNTDLIELMALADSRRNAMQTQKSRAREAGAQSDGAYKLAERHEADAETAYDQQDPDGYQRAATSFATAEQGYAAAAEAAQRNQTVADAARQPARPQQTPAQQPARRPTETTTRPAATTPPPAATTPPPAATTPPPEEEEEEEEPAATPPSRPPQAQPPSSGGFGVSGAGARVANARSVANSARSTAASMRGTVNAAAHEDARYKLARSIEQKAETTLSAGRASEATALFNLAATIYPQIKLGRDMPDILDKSQRHITAVYQRALQRRDLVALQNLFPRASSFDQQVWKQFIDQGGDIAIYLLNSNAKADDNKATIDIAVHLDYTDPQGSKHRSKMEQKWEFAAGDGGWRVSKM